MNGLRDKSKKIPAFFFLREKNKNLYFFGRKTNKIVLLEKLKLYKKDKK